MTLVVNTKPLNNDQHEIVSKATMITQKHNYKPLNNHDNANYKKKRVFNQ